jgi:hypothetical protein
MFSHDNRQESIRDNELTKQLPQHAKVSHPTIYEDNRNFTSLVTRPGRPTKLKEWTETDHPPLSIHVTSFTDATLVTLSWSHVFFDALGRQSFLQAWLAVLDGRDDEVPEFTPYEEDPIVSIAEGGRPWEHIHYGHVLTGIWYVLFVICFIYEMVVYKKEAGRTIRFPGSWVDELRNRAMDELREKGVAEKDAFVSHGDVLLAFWCKTTLAAQHIRSGRPLHIINAMNVRGASEHVPLPDKSAYIGNAVLSATSLTDTAELYKLSVGEVAYLVRENLKKQRTPEQIKAMCAWQLENYNKGISSPLPGSWNQILFSWSNWSRAGFFDLDFSAAVTKTGLQMSERNNKVGRPSLVSTVGHADGLSVRNGGPLIGKDANGDWWLDWTMRAEAWPEVEKAFDSLRS